MTKDSIDINTTIKDIEELLENDYAISPALKASVKMLIVAEGLNSKIQSVKSNARGYRSFSGFRNSILFYCGGLDMLP